MRLLTVLVLSVLVACGRSQPTAPIIAAPDPFVMGWWVDSLTPASPLSAVQNWSFAILIIGIDAQHSGIASQGAWTVNDNGPRQRCLGVAGQLPGERSLDYIAAGDTVPAEQARFFSYWNRIMQGADSLRPVLDSLATGKYNLRGLVYRHTGLFDPTVTTLGRGATVTEAIVRRWQFSDAGITFAEDTSHACIQGPGY